MFYNLNNISYSIIFKNKYYKIYDTGISFINWLDKILNIDVNTFNKNFIILDNIYIPRTIANKNISELIKYINNKNNYDDNIKIKNDRILFLRIEQRIYGGGLIDMFMSIIEIGKVFLILIDAIVWLIKFIAWTIFFIGFLIKFLFYDLIIDFKNSVIIIVVTILRLPLDIFTALFAFMTNSLGGWFTTFWGWDQTNLTQKDRESNYFKSIDTNQGKKCYMTNQNTVPFSILLGTILCPPLGVFMDLGISGWFNILICTFLTLLFYLPGLCYALLILYS